MPKLNKLREFLSERMTAAVLEILGAVEETFADYQEEICRSKEEIGRLRRLLELVTQPEIKLHRLDLKQASDPEPPQSEEPQEEGGRKWEEQPELDSDSDTVDSKDASPTVNNDLSLSLHLYHTQTEGSSEGGYSLVIPMSVVKTEPDGEPCVSAGPPSDSLPFSVAAFSPEDESVPIETEPEPMPLSLQTTPPEKSQSFQGHTDFLSTSGRKMKASLDTSWKRPHQCVTCEKHFSSALALERHRQTRLCKLCDKCFPYKSCLDIHMRGHFSAPFQCIECSKGFKQRAHLVAHMRTHTRQEDLKTYQCKEQGTRQGYRSGLVYHIGALEKDNQCPEEACDTVVPQKTQISM